MSGSPASNWSGLLGRRVEPRRAGMTPRTRITKSNRTSGASQNSCRLLWVRYAESGKGVTTTGAAQPERRRKAALRWSEAVRSGGGDARRDPREEVREDPLPVPRADRFGVELDAHYRQTSVRQTHDLGSS